MQNKQRFHSHPKGQVLPVIIGFNLCLPRAAASVPLVRHLYRDALTELGVIPETIGDIEVALTEACGNVLRHTDGTNSDCDYEVGIEISEDRCEILVVDKGPGFAHDELSHDVIPVERESGRGVFLMRAMVDELKFTTRPDLGTAVSLIKKLESPRSSLLHRLAAAQN